MAKTNLDVILYKEHLSVFEGDCLKDKNEACSIFHAKISQRQGGAKVPYLRNVILWFPKEEDNDWDNSMDNEGITIVERQVFANSTVKESVEKNIRRIDDILKEKEVRITFWREKKDDFKRCRFVGVFRLDEVESRKQKCCVYKRMSYFADLRNLFLLEDKG